MDEEGRDDLTGVRVGDVLAGKYRVERVLGIGAMGVVVAAYDPERDSRVAVKLLRPSMLVHREALVRFSREGRAAVQLAGPHVARVFDVGKLESGAPYIVMELLEGEDLATLLQRQGPRPVTEAVDFVMQACDAVAEAHSLGIVHRDLKPANLFACPRPDGKLTIKVLDFGVSKMTTPATARDQKLTLVSSLVGSPLYMSPEQIEAPDTVDSRTDVWALGVILYELLSMKTPFLGDTLPQVSIRIAVRPPVPIRDVRPEVPEGLARAMAICFEKERARRYADVGELVRALAPFGSAAAGVSIDLAPSANASVRDSVGGAVLTSTSASSSASIRPTTLPAGAPEDARGAPGTSPTIARDRRRHVVAAVIAIAGALALVLSVTSARRARRVGLRGAENESHEVATASRPPLSSAWTNASITAAPALDSSSATGTSPAPALPPASEISKALTATPTMSTVRLAPRRPGASSAVSPSVRPGCELDFELDSQGRKHFKPECVNGASTSQGSAAAQADCDPNYDLDGQGRKHFKPQCFLNASH